jgi:exopolyphosphatase/guanosine-5'-triphosphate,3'-diphosphate pyrophosphatase
MNKRQALIDIGSHSVLFLAAENDGGARSLRILAQDRVATKLLATAFSPQSDAVAATRQAIARFVATAEELNCPVIAFATEALRRSDEQQFFLDMLAQDFGLACEIMSGNEEALYTYRANLPEHNQTVCIADLGSGSLEMARGKGDTIAATASFKLGVLHLSRQLQLNPHVGMRDYDRLQAKLDERKLKRFLKMAVGHRLVVSGGTASALCEIAAEQHPFDEYLSLTRSQCWSLFTRFNQLPVEERSALLSEGSERAPYLSVGILILIVIMQKMQVDRIYLSQRGARFGKMMELLQ